MEGTVLHARCRYGAEETRGSVFARDRGQGWGTCRKHAPAVVVIQSPSVRRFRRPRSRACVDDDWCGDLRWRSSRRSGGYAGLDHP